MGKNSRKTKRIDYKCGANDVENNSTEVVPASADEILAWWETAHFSLNAEQQIRFKNDLLLSNLLKLHGQAVKEAILINKIKRIMDIHLVAAALQSAKMPTPIPTSKSAQTKLIKVFPKKFTKRTTGRTTTRGRESFREHGMINPPPAERLNIDRSKLPKCSICNQAIVGAMCGCW